MNGVARLLCPHQVLENASRMGVVHHMHSDAIFKANPKVCLAFCAQIFHTKHGLFLPAGAPEPEQGLRACRRPLWE